MTKTFRNCLLSIITFACLAFVFTLNVKAAEPYTLNVGSVTITAGNAGIITGDDISGTVSYDEQNRILTLNNATITGTSQYSVYHDPYKEYFANTIICYEGKEDLTIRLIGTNVLSSDVANWGIYAGVNKLTFVGDGSLTIKQHSISGDDITRKIKDYGICCGTLIVSKASTIIANGASSALTESYGVCATYGMEIYGKLTATGTTRASGYATGYSSFGVCIPGSNGTIKVDGSLYASGNADNDDSYGIYFKEGGKITIAEAADLMAFGTDKAFSGATITLASSALKILAGSSKASVSLLTLKNALSKKYVSINKTNKAPAVKKAKITVPTTYITSLKRSKKAFKIRWKKKAVSGYQIRYSRKSSMSGAKKITIKSKSTVYKKVKHLKKKKKYYVQIRTYIKAAGKTYYSKWSKKKSVKTK